MKKDLNYLKGIYIAHRGLHDNSHNVPENSLIAFERAVNENIAIELDLHILKDNQIIVFHDDNLKRMTGYDKEIKNCTYEEIKDLKLLNTENKIPLFKEVLELVNGKVLIDMEFKCDNKVGVLEKEACKLLSCYRGKFIVKSFNPFSVKWFKDNKPEYVRGQISCDFRNENMSIIKKFILKNMLLNFITKPDFIVYDIDSITKKQIDKCKNKNILLFLWNIDTGEKLSLAKEYGDSFIYENLNIK